MFKKVVLGIFFCVFALSHAWADMYAIHGIHVDVTAQNATLAKEQGVTEAQEKAFYKMLDRLTLFKDMEALPVLTTEDILNLVQDFSVSNEKTSSIRYIADVDVQFNPEAIQTFFQEYQVPYVTTTAEKSVVFPVYKDALNAPVLLWKDTNPWSKILAKATLTSDLVPLVVPLGDLDDMALISEDNWINEEALDITPLLNRYQTANALVAELTVLKEDNVVKVLVRPFQNKKNLISEITATEPINAPMPEVLKRAANRVVYLLEQAWREKNAVRFDNPTQIEVSVHIQNLAEWIAVRKRLDKIKLIKQYVVKALRRDQAEIEIFFAGDIRPFKTALKKEELFLSSVNDKWLLRNLSDVTPEEISADEQANIIQPAPVSEEAQTPVIDNVIIATEPLLNADSLVPEAGASADSAPLAPQQAPEIEVRTFDPVLYQAIEIQPETQEMLREMEQGEHNAIP